MAAAILLALLGQDPGHDLTLAQSKGQESIYRHELTVTRGDRTATLTAKVRYRIESLDASRQHSGEYTATVLRLDFGDLHLEKALKPILFRSGTHG